MLTNKEKILITNNVNLIDDPDVISLISSIMKDKSIPSSDKLPTIRDFLISNGMFHDAEYFDDMKEEEQEDQEEQATVSSSATEEPKSLYLVCIENEFIGFETKDSLKEFLFTSQISLSSVEVYKKQKVDFSFEDFN